MNLTVTEESLIIHINREFLNFNYQVKEKIEEYIKNLIIKIKKIYKVKISGSYKVNIYQNNNYGFIIELNKQEGLDFFPDLIDLKINMFYDSNIFLKIEDYFLINNYKGIYYYKDNYYIDIKNISNKDNLNLSEFSTYIYGTKLNDLKNKMILIK